MNKNENKKIDSVKNKISIFANENKDLIHKIEDCKQTLDLNYEILKKTFILFGGDEKLINDKIIKGKSLFNKYENLIKKRKEIQKDIYSLKKNIENKTIKIYKEIEVYSKENEKLSEEIKLKDIDIKKLKEDLVKIRGKAFFKKATREIKVCPPTKYNVVINQEIINEKNIITKAININSKKEGIMKKIKSKYTSLYNQLQKESEENNIKINNIEQFKLSEESEYQEFSFSSDEDSEEKRNNEQLSIEKLKEKKEYLLKKFKDYKNKIDIYKRDYKIYKQKILDMKNFFLKK